MRFGVLAAIEVSSALVGIVVGIVSALYDAGYWALVLMHLSTALARTVGVWLGCRWRPGLPVRGVGVRSMLAFGGNLAGFSVVNYFARNLDNILIGRVWGARSLGFYSKAYNLLMLPLRQISAPMSAVAIPALSRLQDDGERFRDYYLKSLSIIVFFTAPLSLFCVVLADELILTILGSQWLDASGIFRLLAIGALAQPIGNTAGWLYVATGRTREMLKYGSIGVGLIVTSFFVGLPYGGDGVALCYSCVVLLWTWPCMHFAARSTLVDWKGILGAIGHPLLGALTAGVAVLVLRFLLRNTLAEWAVLLIGAVVMGAVYLLVVFYIFGRKKSYVSVLRSLRKTGSTSA